MLILAEKHSQCIQSTQTDIFKFGIFISQYIQYHRYTETIKCGYDLWYLPVVVSKRGPWSRKTPESNEVILQRGERIKNLKPLQVRNRH